MTAGMVLGVGRKRGMASTLSAPVRGWNTRDPISEMKDGYALTLDNWFPDSSKISLRRGYRSHSTGMSSDVESLLTWEGPSSSKLFAFANTKIWDASTYAGTASDVTNSTTITNNKWIGQNFGGKLTCVNGVDECLQYSGSTWAHTGFTGVTEANLANINAYRSRLYMVEKSTWKVWYGAADAITGALTSFDMQYVAKSGGYLMAQGNISRDSGAGADDVTAFVGSTGEVLVYEGSYPGDTTWKLIGRYKTAPPIGRKCLFNVGGELVIITKAGLVSMSEVMTTAEGANTDVRLTRNIAPTFNQAARDYGDNFGWQVILHPRGTMGICNIPIVEGDQAHQYVWNTLTGAWCRFKNIPAICWAIFNDKPYFGGNSGVVYEFDVTNSDAGAAIAGDVRPAFSYLGKRGMRKQFHLAKPIFVADSALSLSVDLEVDYQESTPNNTVSLTGASGTAWDDGDWDSFDWAGGALIYQDTYGVSGLGDCASLRIRSSTVDVQIALNAMSLYYTPASFL